MSRAPFQVLVIPFFQIENHYLYSLFQRQHSTGGIWQWVSGGGEDNESPEESAIRELSEETRICENFQLYGLDSMCTIQKDIYRGHENWDKEIFVVPEHSFAVEVKSKKITISKEHQDQKWVLYDEAMELLKWDSNKTALWELDQKIKKNGLKEIRTNL